MTAMILRLLFANLCLATASVMAAQPENVRAPNADGANCARLLLKLFGKRDTGPSIPIATLTDVAIFLRSSGLPAVAYRMKTADISKVPAPSIVLCESGDSEKGTISLYCGITESGDVLFVDGGSGLVSTVSTETFLRMFTGLGVMVKDHDLPLFSLLILLGGMFSLGLSIAYCTWSMRNIQYCDAHRLPE